MKHLFKEIIGHTVTTLIAVLLVTLVSDLLKNWTSDQIVFFTSQTYDYIKLHQTSVKITATVFVVFFTNSLRIVLSYIKKGRAARSIGLFYCSDNSNRKAREESDKFLINKSRESRDLLILGATGAATFTNPGSPLHEAVKKAPSLKVMLLNPLSAKTIKIRAAHVGIDCKRYQGEIINSLFFLRELKQKRPEVSLEVKLYNNYPFWKYLFLRGYYVWAQQYPNENHVRDAPCYAFELLRTKKGIEYGVYLHMEAQFQRRWDSNRLGWYDLVNDNLLYFDNNGQETNRVHGLLEQAKLLNEQPTNFCRRNKL